MGWPYKNQVLSYATTNREGYREYKSKSYVSAKAVQQSKNAMTTASKKAWIRLLLYMLLLLVIP